MLFLDDIALQPLRETDIPAIATLANNYQIWKNVRDRLPHPYSEQDAHDFVSIIQQELSLYTFGIHYQGTLAGIIGLVPQDDVYKLNAEIGYWIGEPFWNKGIATKAVQLMITYAFGTLEFHRLFAGVFAHNLASMKVLTKTGFELEGIAKQAILKEGKLIDEYRYALIRAKNQETRNPVYCSYDEKG